MYLKNGVCVEIDSIEGLLSAVDMTLSIQFNRTSVPRKHTTTNPPRHEKHTTQKLVARDIHAKSKREREGERVGGEE
jgi:hypothetical protein